MELETFKHTVLPLREKLQHIAYMLTDNRADAEDVVQETFLKLWKIRDQLDQHRSVEALAVMVTKNTALDTLKARKPKAPKLEMTFLEAGTGGPAERLEQKDAVDCIRQLIDRLPSLQQITIRMKDIEGYELSEIAEITGTQVETVRVNLSRARKRVREQFLAINQEKYAYR
ncbi:MAG: RNA polymerase sigma factor [Tannerellaceae bacterium]|nr:RNA polymerase sigma factor [Tannerellaceae bacterium]